MNADQKNALEKFRDELASFGECWETYDNPKASAIAQEIFGFGFESNLLRDLSNAESLEVIAELIEYFTLTEAGYVWLIKRLSNSLKN